MKKNLESSPAPGAGARLVNAAAHPAGGMRLARTRGTSISGHIAHPAGNGLQRRLLLCGVPFLIGATVGITRSAALSEAAAARPLPAISAATSESAEIRRVATRACRAVFGPDAETAGIFESGHDSVRDNCRFRAISVMCESGDGRFLLTVNGSTGGVLGIYRISPSGPAAPPADEMDSGEQPHKLTALADAQATANHYLAAVGEHGIPVRAKIQLGSYPDPASWWVLLYRVGTPGAGHLVRVTIDRSDGHLIEYINFTRTDPELGLRM